MTGPVAQALAALSGDAGAHGWTSLPFFTEGAAQRVAARIDARAEAGATVLPEAQDIFAAFRETPLAAVRVVIVGQDPYPTPGDAHGLAFSYRGGKRLPPSLKTILAECADDLGGPPPDLAAGDLTRWARQGVLLLNTALTVEAGRAGAHLGEGWATLADEVLAVVSAQQPAVVFMLWGASARRRAALVDGAKHLVLACGHPSPLNRVRDFRGQKMFSRANGWLNGMGRGEVAW